MIGYPPYKIHDCIRYLMYQLSNAGFTVSYIFPKAINVSWCNAAPPPVTVPERPAPLLTAPSLNPQHLLSYDQNLLGHDQNLLSYDPLLMSNSHMLSDVPRQHQPAVSVNQQRCPPLSSLVPMQQQCSLTQPSNQLISNHKSAFRSAVRSKKQGGGLTLDI